MENGVQKSGSKLKTFWWLLGFLVFVGILALASTKPPHLTEKEIGGEQTKVVFDEPIVLHFNEAMNKNSVQKAFSITPKIAGKFKWANSTTLEFHPEKPLELEAEYQVKIKSSARSLWFKKMVEEDRQDFLVTGPPYLLFKSPEEKGTWGKEKAITVMFDRPMTLAEMKPKDLIQIKPTLEGEIRILGHSAFQFIPENLDPRISYEIEVPAGLPALEGGNTREGATWTISPASNTVLTSTPEPNQITGLNQNLEIEFDQPIDLSQIKPGNNIQLYPSNDLEETKEDGFFNTEVRYGQDESGNKSEKILSFTPTFPFKEGQVYELILKADDALGLTEDFSLSFQASEQAENSEFIGNSNPTEVQLFLAQDHFKPREILQLKGVWRVLQNGQLTLPQADSVKLKLLDGFQVASEKIALVSETGSFNSDFPLPENLAEGEYKLLVTDAQDQALGTTVSIHLKNEKPEFELEWAEIQNDTDLDQNPVYTLQARLINGLPAAKLAGEYKLYRQSIGNFSQFSPHDLQSSCLEECETWEKVTDGQFQFDEEGKIRMGLEENDGSLLKDGYEYQWVVEVEGENGEKIVTVQRFRIQAEENKLEEELPPAEEETESPFEGGLVEAANESLTTEIIWEPAIAKPGEEVRVIFKTTDAQGQPVVSELAVNMVEGAVGSQNFSVQSFLSSHPLPLFASESRSFYFNPSIETNEKGEASILLELPENLQNPHLQVLATAGNRQFGFNQDKIPLEKGLSIKPILPEVVMPGDETTFSAIIKNNSEKTINTAVHLEAAYVIATVTNQNISLEPYEEKKIDFKVTINPFLEIETREIKIEFLSEKSSATQMVGVIQKTASVDLIENNLPEGISSIILASPETLNSQRGHLDFTLSLSPLGMIQGWIEALEEVEADNAFLSAVQIIVGAHKDESEKKESLTEKVTTLMAERNEEGGFAWHAEEAADPVLTATAVLAFSEAKDKGIKVNASALQKTLTFLLSALENSDLSPSDQVFIGWVLSREGQYDTEKTLRLYKEVEENDVVAKAFLLLTLENLRQAGQKSTIPFIDNLKKDLLAKAGQNREGMFFEGINEDKKLPTAIVLYAFARLDAKNPILPEMMSYLVHQETDIEAGLNPHQAIWMILAIEAFTEGLELSDTNLKAQIKLNGALLFNRGLNEEQAENIYRFSKSTSGFDLNRINYLQVKKTGKGELYMDVHWTAPLIPEKMVRREEGVVLVREIYSVDDPQKVPVMELKQNEEYVSQLIVVIPQALSGVKIELPPSGEGWLKPEKLDASFKIIENSARGVVYFAPHLEPGVYYLESELQPLIPGSYHQFPSTLSSIMEPSIFASTEGGIIKVVE